MAHDLPHTGTHSHVQVLAMLAARVSSTLDLRRQSGVTMGIAHSPSSCAAGSPAAWSGTATAGVASWALGRGVVPAGASPLVDDIEAAAEAGLTHLATCWIHSQTR